VHVKVFFEVRVEKGEKTDVSGVLPLLLKWLKAHCRIVLTKEDSSLDVDILMTFPRCLPLYIFKLCIYFSGILFYARHSLISSLFQPIITTYKVLAENSALRLVSVINYIYERATWPSG